MKLKQSLQKNKIELNQIFYILLIKLYKNQKLNQYYKKGNIVKIIRSARLEWAGTYGELKIVKQKQYL